MEAILEWVGLRTVVLLLIIVGLITAFIYRGVKKKRLLSFTTVSLSLLLILNGYSEYRFMMTQVEGTQIAVQVSRNSESHLKCQRFSEAFFDAQTFKKGFVSYAKPNTGLLKYQPCKDLQSFLNGSKEDFTDGETLAFAILIHEAVHTSGEFSEEITECVTHKLYVPTAISIGVGQAIAESMLNTYLTVYHTNQSSKYQYIDGACDEHRLLDGLAVQEADQ